MPTMPTDADLADFVDECGWRSSTLTNACSVLRRWERWLTARDVAVMAATHRDLKAYLAERDQAGVGAATRHKEWQVLRAVYEWAARSTVPDPHAKRQRDRRPGAGILTADPMVRVAAPYVSPTPRVRYATAADVAALEDYFGRIARQRRGGGEAERGLRNAAMVSMMFRSGCRVGDLPWIDLGHLVRDAHDRLVACQLGGDDGSHTKSGRSRLVPVLDETPVLLERYLRRRGTTPGPLFLGRAVHTADPDRRLTAAAIRDVVGRAAKACGVTISSHDMRRAWTVESKRRGVPDLSIRLAAGWSSDAMLLRYFGPAAEQLAVDDFHAATAPAPRLRVVGS